MPATDRVKQILSWYGSDNPGTKANLARMLKSVVQRMNRALENPSYNLVIHSAPFSEPRNDFYHWHVEILPKLARVAGFEAGTGFYINPTSPEEATQVLRSVRL